MKVDVFHMRIGDFMSGDLTGLCLYMSKKVVLAPIDFDQRMACGALGCLSKYRTGGISEQLIVPKTSKKWYQKKLMSKNAKNPSALF